MNLKKFSFLLVIIFCFTLLMSCAGDTTAEKELVAEKPKLMDFYGREFIVSSAWIEYLCPAEGISLSLDETRTWWKKVEKDLNCIITPVKGEYNINLLASISAGIKEADILFIEGKNMYSLAKQECLENLDELANIQPLDAKQWSQNYGRELYTYKGITYGVAPAGVLETTGQLRGGGMICNDELVKAFNITHPNELYEQKKWTFQTFEELLPLVTDTNPENRVYGLFYSDEALLPKSAILANGGSPVVETEGKKVFGYTQKNALDALEWATRIASMKDSYKKISYDKGDFANNSAIFYIDQSWMIMDTTLEYSLIMNEVEFSWLRFPYGPSAEYGETISAFTTSNDQVYSIPVNADDAEESAYLLSYWQNAERGDPEGSVNKAMADEEMSKRQNFFNDKSYDTFKYLSRNMVMDFPYALDDQITNLNNALIAAVKGNKAPSEVMSAIEEPINTALAEE